MKIYFIDIEFLYREHEIRKQNKNIENYNRRFNEQFEYRYARFRIEKNT